MPKIINFCSIKYCILCSGGKRLFQTQYLIVEKFIFPPPIFGKHYLPVLNCTNLFFFPLPHAAHHRAEMRATYLSKPCNRSTTICTSLRAFKAVSPDGMGDGTSYLPGISWKIPVNPSSSSALSIPP